MQCRFLSMVSATLILVIVTSSAAPFQNLEFEQANTNSLSFDPGPGIAWGPIEDLLPGWQIIAGSPTLGTTNFLTELSFNSESSVALNDHDFFDARIPRSGKYSLSISSPPMDITLVQYGEVPQWAGALNGPVLATVNPFVTFQINGVPLESTRSPFLPGLDVSHHAGQNAELKIIFPAGNYYARLDGFVFLVPEPSVLTLVVASLFTIPAWRVLLRRKPSNQPARAALRGSRER